MKLVCLKSGSDVYMLKNVSDRTTPCGTPFLNWSCVDRFQVHYPIGLDFLFITFLHREC